MSSRAEKRRDARDGGSEMTKLYIVLGVVAVVALAAVGYSVGSGGGGSAATEPVDVEGLDDMETLIALAQGVSVGDDDAPITIVEFGDYQCPGCGAFAMGVKPQVDLRLVQSGRANFIFYDFPLTTIHPHAFLAARSARCAGDQGKYWEYHSEIFRNQSSWSPQASPIGAFVDYAETVGMDADAFESCVRSDRHADVVTANMRLGYELGVSGTPTVMVSQGQGMARRLPSNDFQTILGVVESIEAELAGGADTSGAGN